MASRVLLDHAPEEARVLREGEEVTSAGLEEAFIALTGIDQDTERVA